MVDKTMLTGIADVNYSSQYTEVLGSKMHSLEQGSGEPILLLHDIPTSCYVWRKIIPLLAPLGRCIAPDFIGMGRSDKPDIVYTLEDHVRYLEQFIDVRKLKKITLIMHGWGSLIGLDYAMRHPENCKGLVFYEAFLKPLCGADLSLPFQEQRVALKEELFINGSSFLDKILAQSMLHKLTPEDLKHYYEPFLQHNDSSKELLTALKQYWHELPTGDGNSKVDRFIERYSEKLMQSSLPKLLLYSIPGFITTMATVMWAKENLPCLELGEVGEELHYSQEAQPQLMGELISSWLQAVEQQVVIS
jgi:haloalkane dehalogenase